MTVITYLESSLHPSLKTSSKWTYSCSHHKHLDCHAVFYALGLRKIAFNDIVGEPGDMFFYLTGALKTRSTPRTLGSTTSFTFKRANDPSFLWPSRSRSFDHAKQAQHVCLSNKRHCWAFKSLRFGNPRKQSGCSVWRRQSLGGLTRRAFVIGQL